MPKAFNIVKAGEHPAGPAPGLGTHDQMFLGDGYVSVQWEPLINIVILNPGAWWIYFRKYKICICIFSNFPILR